MWRDDPQQPIKNYSMTMLTLGISASPFVAIMAMRQNAVNNQMKYPFAAQAVMNDFYKDDGLNRANSIDEAETQELFELEGFVLRI